MDDKAKYFKALNDLLTNKKNAIQTKLDIAKFMGEIVKKGGDINSVINEKNAQKRTSLDLKNLRSALAEASDTDNYNLKKN